MFLVCLILPSGSWVAGEVAPSVGVLGSRMIERVRLMIGLLLWIIGESLCISSIICGSMVEGWWWLVTWVSGSFHIPSRRRRDLDFRS
ncbi:hypothetical protein AVEN_167354-1 [Araneus ventricosus]|uniref:Uncharacterized protein n=1 Tax=Araneus ventricosus TaxID=182803 RepID=A0A4Y2QID8_ARAVE|nr:hypothetical protein AVEN_167354-1 [Araneus ventricosus]